MVTVGWIARDGARTEMEELAHLGDAHAPMVHFAPRSLRIGVDRDPRVVETLFVGFVLGFVWLWAARGVAVLSLCCAVHMASPWR